MEGQGQVQDWPQTKTRTARRFVTNRESVALYVARSGLCGVCNLLVPPEDLAIDHIIPRSKGGSDLIDNLQIAHTRCNQTKHSLLPGEPTFAEKRTARLAVQEADRTTERERYGPPSALPAIIVGSDIQRWRKARGLTQHELGRWVGVYSNVISLWERNTAERAAPARILALGCGFWNDTAQRWEFGQRTGPKPRARTVDFDTATAYVMEKDKELLERLADGPKPGATRARKETL